MDMVAERQPDGGDELGKCQRTDQELSTREWLYASEARQRNASLHYFFGCPARLVILSQRSRLHWQGHRCCGRPFNHCHAPRTRREHSVAAQSWATTAVLGRTHQGNPYGLSVSRCGPAVLLCRWESSKGHPPKALTGEASKHRAVENSRWTSHFAD